MHARAGSPADNEQHLSPRLGVLRASRRDAQTSAEGTWTCTQPQDVSNAMQLLA